MRARALTPPIPNATIDAEFEEAEFFELHGELFRAAWREIGLADDSLAPFDDARAIAPTILHAIAALRAAPSVEREEAVRSLFNETAPGIFCVQLLREESIAALRTELIRVAAAGIPTRRPNGMNRFGVILDETVDGAVSNGIDVFVKALIDQYVRPLGRMLFPDIIGDGDDVEHFVFTVRYEPTKDATLAEHRDASVVTLNLNLNKPGEGFGGSALYFVDEADPAVRHTVDFTPGMALIHKGALRHAALPIRHGSRENLICWLFGTDGYVRAAPHTESERLTVAERWGLGQRHARSWHALWGSNGLVDRGQHDTTKTDL